MFVAVRVSVDVCSVHRNRLTARFPHSGSKAQWLRTLVSHLYSLQRAPTSDKRLVRRNYLSLRMRPHAFSRRFTVDRWPRIASAANGLRRLHHESASQASELKQDRQKETVDRGAFFVVVVVYALDRRGIHSRSDLCPWPRQHDRLREYGSDKREMLGPPLWPGWSVRKLRSY